MQEADIIGRGTVVDRKDVVVRVAGLLQSVIASGVGPECWEPLARKALVLHSKLTNEIIERSKNNGKENQGRTQG